MATFGIPKSLRDRLVRLASRTPRGVPAASQRGVAAVEFALLLPILMLLVLATLQTADAFYCRKLLLGAADSAARTGVVQTSTLGQVNQALETYLGATRIGGAYSSAVVGVGAGATGDTLVTVTLRYDFPLFATLPALGWTAATVPLSASVTLRHE